MNQFLSEMFYFLKLIFYFRIFDSYPTPPKNGWTKTSEERRANPEHLCRSVFLAANITVPPGGSRHDTGLFLYSFNKYLLGTGFGAMDCHFRKSGKGCLIKEEITVSFLKREHERNTRRPKQSEQRGKEWELREQRGQGADHKKCERSVVKPDTWEHHLLSAWSSLWLSCFLLLHGIRILPSLGCCEVKMWCSE